MINLIRKIWTKRQISFIILLFFIALSGVSLIINIPKAMANPDDSVLEINDAQYPETYAKIRTNPQLYKGKKIAVKGFVYKSSDYGKNNFLLARIYMYCCAADAEVVGYLSSWDKVNDLKSGEWLKATGIIDYKTRYEPLIKAKLTAPYLKIIKVEHIKQPEPQYVY